MYVTVNCKALAHALSLVGGVCPTKTPKPILKYVKFKTNGEDGEPALIATNLELSIAAVVPGVVVQEHGSALLDPAKLKEILARAKCDEVSIELDGDTVHIRGKRVKYDLPTEDSNLFPSPPSFDAGQFYNVAAADLRRAITQTVHATDKDGTSARFAMSGCLAEFRADSLTMVGTDGKRLSESVVPAEAIGDVPAYVLTDKNPVIFSPAFMRLAIKTTADDDPPVSIAIDPKSSVLARTRQATIYGRLVEGKFPKYTDIFDSIEKAGRLTVKAGAFLEAVEQAAITRSVESSAVDFSYSSGLLALCSSAADVGKSEVEADIEYAGPAILTSVNPDYLIPALRCLPEDADVELTVSKKSPQLFATEGNRYVVMPLMKGTA